MAGDEVARGSCRTCDTQRSRQDLHRQQQQPREIPQVRNILPFNNEHVNRFPDENVYLCALQNEYTLMKQLGAVSSGYTHFA